MFCSQTQTTQQSHWGRWQDISRSLLLLLSCSPDTNSMEPILGGWGGQGKERNKTEQVRTVRTASLEAPGEGCYHRPASPPPACPCRRSPLLRCASCRGWSWSCRSSACGGLRCRSSCPPAPGPGAWCPPRCPRCGNCCGWWWSGETGACASCCPRCSRWPGTAFPAGPCQGPGCH